MEKCAEYMLQSAEIVPETSEANSKLRCLYLSLCRDLCQNGNVELPSKLFGNHVMCKFCSNPWKYGHFTIRVLPKTLPGIRMKKIIHKSLDSQKKLTKHEARLLERCQKDNTNKLSLLCLLCHKKTVIPVTKPAESFYKTVDETPVIENMNVNTISKKKRKKKRDPFAGLNASVCTPLMGKFKQSSSQGSIKTSTQKISAITQTPKGVPMRTKAINSGKLTNTNKLQKLLLNTSKKPKTSALKAFLDSMTK